MERRKRRTWRTVLLAVLAVMIGLGGLAWAAYHGVEPVVALEYGAELTPTLFTARDASFAEPYEGVSREKGRHELYLSIDRFPLKVPVWVDVADTTAPTAEPVRDLLLPLGETLTPDQLLMGIQDRDLVEVYFGQEPDFRTVGPHTVPVVVEDVTGNRATIECGYLIRGVIDGITVEAGAALPDMAAYLLADPQRTGAALVSDYDPALTRHVGTYPVAFHFDYGDQDDRSHLTVVDTAAPTGTGTSVIVLPDMAVTPELFVTDVSDETDVALSFAVPPDMACHDPQNVVVRLTDEGENTTDVTAEAVITTLAPMTLEASKKLPGGQVFGLSDQAQVEEYACDVPGTYLVKLWHDGQEEAVLVTVVDSTAPTLRARAVGTRYACHPMTVEELFSAEDVSAMELAFLTEPDWTQPGEQEVVAVATDAYGNRATCSQRVTLLADEEPPHIVGATDRNIYKDESVAYLAGVSAEDDIDGTVEVTVSTAVDIHREGAYEVVYTAADLCGNTDTVTCTFTVIEPTVTDAEVRALAQSVMAEITTPDMVDAEKLNAIYWYVRKHVLYRNGVNKNYSDWRKAACDGFVNGRGDCYNIWAVTRALLDEAGIEYESVERVKSRRRPTRHYWVHVNVGTGWYVFDPTWTPLHKFTCFMWTEAQCDSCRQYWQFDKAKHHSLATERFDYDVVVQAERSARGK